jgi:hypothetical protein
MIGAVVMMVKILVEDLINHVHMRVLVERYGGFAVWGPLLLIFLGILVVLYGYVIFEDE